MTIQLADVTIHIDESLGVEERQRIQDRIRAVDGVVSVSNPDERPHLTIVGYDPAKASSAALLEAVTSQGVHAELIGL